MENEQVRRSCFLTASEAMTNLAGAILEMGVSASTYSRAIKEFVDSAGSALEQADADLRAFIRTLPWRDRMEFALHRRFPNIFPMPPQVHIKADQWMADRMNGA
jgi:hypothetical protein